MAFTRVQGTGKVHANSTTLVLPAWSAPPTVGNGVIIAVNIYNIGSAVSGVADNHGNPYVVGHAQIGGSSPGRSDVWYCAHLTATGSPLTITVTLSASSNADACGVEVSGVGGGLAVDQSVGASGAAAGTIATGSTPSLGGPDSYLVAALIVGSNQASGITVQTATPPWVQELQDLTGGNPGGEVDSRALSGTTGTTQSCNWATTGGATQYLTHLVAFKATAAPVVPTGSTTYLWMPL